MLCTFRAGIVKSKTKTNKKEPTSAMMLALEFQIIRLIHDIHELTKQTNFKFSKKGDNISSLLKSKIIRTF